MKIGDRVKLVIDFTDDQGYYFPLNAEGTIDDIDRSGKATMFGIDFDDRKNVEYGYFYAEDLELI